MLKKSQITLFLLIGMVVIVVFGFLFYTSNIVAKTKMEKRAEKITADLFETIALKYYVTTCLEDSLKKGLMLLGEQGGFLYKDQNSIIDWDIPYEEYTHDSITSKVAYQIYSSTMAEQIKPFSLITAGPFYYPCFLAGKPEWVGHTCYKSYDHTDKWYPFGTTGEPNKTINPDLCNKYISEGPYMCKCTTESNCKYSIQNQLESFIEYETSICVNFSSFTTYNVTKGDLKANVTFENSGVNAILEFPITITIKGYQPVIKILDFYAEQPIRFKSVYTIARAIINKDIYDVEFKIKEDSAQLINSFGSLYNGISVDLEQIFDYNDIIKITDTKSNIDGKNYTFMFLRENRRPALDYFKDASPPPNYDMYTIAGGKLDFSQVVNHAYDPDEDGIEIEYNVIEDAKWDSVKANAIKNDIEETSYYETSEDGYDNGEHNIVIVAKEKESSFIRDWQNVSILVDDKPNVVIKTDNFYDDIVDNTYASIEDIFLIDLSGSENFYGGALEYRLEDSLEGACNSNPFVYTSTYKIYFPAQDAAIDDVSGCFDTTGIHDITVQARDTEYPLSIGIGVEQVNVGQCLPHRSDAAPFPFHLYAYDSYPNPLNNDPFQSDHTCCSDTNIINSGNECYELTDYGCRKDVDFTYSTPEYTASFFGNLGFTLINPEYPPSSEVDLQRNVYKRTISVKCSGDRGNICSVVNSPRNYNYKIQYLPTKTCASNACCKYSLDEADVCKPCPS